MYKEVPTYENGVWKETVFETREEFRDFVFSCFHEEGAGTYGFDETSFLFNSEARRFNKDGIYCTAPFRSKDFINYWNDQKKKSRNGVIFKNNGKTWYLTRDYYFWINFLPIYDKVEKKFDFPSIWDSQYHMALYELLAELFYKHAPVLKKRQFGSSYFHTAKLINQYWFEQGAVLKMGASLKNFINDSGSWKFLNEYRDFLNKHTAWYRDNNPNKALFWQQKIEEIVGGRATTRGLKSVITGTSFEKDPTNGVGGPLTFFFHEECFGKGTKILMSDYSVKCIEDIKVGDYVMGYNGKPKKVCNTSYGIDDLYQIEQQKGTNYIVNSKHLLVLEQKTNSIGYSGDGLKLYTPVEFLNIKSKYRKQVTYGIKSSGTFHDDNQQLKIDPYFLGLWLGDGIINTAGIVVNRTKDKELIDFINSYSKINNCGVSVKKSKDDRLKYKDDVVVMLLTRQTGKINPIKETLRSINIFSDKRIPPEYFLASYEDRLKLLAGLIDTDGSLKKGSRSYNFSYEISITKESLAQDIILLARSLGFYVSHTKRPAKKSLLKNGKTINSKEFTRICIRGNVNKIPVKIHRKKVPLDWVPTSNPLNTRIDVTPVGRGEYYGITLNGDNDEDRWFLLEDFTIVHNCGIAPKMTETFEFMRPALQSGMITTGLFIAAGSVGDLDQCEPLKEFIMYPERNQMFYVTTSLIDKNGTIGKSGLFIPEQWSMPPYIDKYGNSLVEEALEAIKKQRINWKKDLSPEQYQLRISQHPTSIEEAFAARKDSIFPVHILSHQKKRIEDKEFPFETVDLFRDGDGKVQIKHSNKMWIKDFPVDKKQENKEGVICMYERPIPNAPWMTYYASIDPVKSGKTVSSVSLCSIYIYKVPTEVVKRDSSGEIVHEVEQGQIVAWWCGRFDDAKKNHERLEMMIELYNAWTIVENNYTNFTQYMMERKKQKYLVRRDQMVFLKEIGANKTVYENYGWSNTGNMFKDHLIPYLIEFMTEEINHKTDGEGNIIKTEYGISRIPDIMALVEAQAYQPGMNVDRLISLSALAAFIQIQKTNRNITRRVEVQEDKLENTQKMNKLNMSSPFKHIGSNSKSLNFGNRRSGFKNLR